MSPANRDLAWSLATAASIVATCVAYWHIFN